MISVVIPTHNRSALLSRTLASALAQRGVEMRVIVVDDGSRDETAAMLARVGDPRLTILRHEQARGVSAARNAGIAAATGEWVAFLDDDDLWSPTKLAEQVSAATDAKAIWACSGSVTFVGDGRIVSGRPPPAAEEIVATLPIRNCFPTGSSNVIVRRRALAEVGGFDEGLRHMPDWDLWIRLVRFGGPVVVNDPSVGYRLHETNASTDSAAIDREIERIEERSKELRGGRPIDRAYVYRWTAWNLLRAGKRMDALRAYAGAVAAGDIASLGRAMVGLVDPGIASRALARHRPDAAWIAPAERWLRAAL